MTDEYKQRWDYIIILFVIFNSFSVPLDIAFAPKSMKSISFLICMAIIDIAFLLDILICFRTTVIGDDGREITNGRGIAIYYVKGTFVVDLIAGIPLEQLMPSN